MNPQKSNTMKKLFAILILLALAISASAQIYDFSAVCETGQTLYYHITDNTNFEVALTKPWFQWNPTGDLIIPETVEYQGEL